MKAFYNLEEIYSIPMLDVCKLYGVPVESKGRSHFCKLRDEKTASCKLYLNNKDGYDSFYDFGSHVGGNVIKFVSELLSCDWQQAVEDLATRFHIEPVNNTEYFNRNELTDLEYEKIGVYGDRATKNFDFDLEKFSLESAQKFSEKYNMPVNQLRKEYPMKYVCDVIKKRAIPFVYNMRNDYYFSLYCLISMQKSLFGRFDINNVPRADLKECEEKCNKLIKAELLLKKALRGTDVSYSFKEYHVLKDIKKIYYGEISFEIGEKTYVDVKRESTLQGVDLRYRAVDCNDYLSLKEFGIDSVFHAAFLKDDKVNLVFLPENDYLVDRIITDYHAEKLKSACIEVLKNHYGVDVSKEQLFNGSETLQKLTQYFLTVLMNRSQDYGLSEKEILMYSQAAMFHDVGKVLVDQNILNKPGQLNKEEYDTIKLHPQLGLDVLEKIDNCDPRLLESAKYAAHMHHERWDGAGYPEGVAGAEIPVYVQVISLADVYNALRSERPYKKALSHEEAVKMIRGGECGAFNPEILSCLDELGSLSIDLYESKNREPGVDHDIDSTQKTTLVPGVSHGNSFSNRDR